MVGLKGSLRTARPGLMVCLGRDKRANVLPMVAVGLVPLIAMIGGAIDASRLYMAKTRLQQACDSGALAGRRAMVNATVLTNAEKDVAKKFFDFNFPNGTYSATVAAPIFAKGTSDGMVTGSASIVMPTTIMKFFGFETVPLSVTCEATLVIPNTDIMFVLDVTGSMLDPVSGTDPTIKLDGLKAAVKDFYSTLGPGTATGPGRIRYGFVPYSSNVNVGRLIYEKNPAWIAGGSGSEFWEYQTREAKTVPENYIASRGNQSGHTNATPVENYSWSTTWSNSGTVDSYPGSFSNITQSTCNGKAVPPTTRNLPGFNSPVYQSEENVAYPDTTQTTYYSSSTNGSGPATRYRYEWTANSSGSTNGTCRLRKNDGTVTATRASTTTRTVTWAVRQKFDYWNYTKLRQDWSLITQTIGGNTTVPNPAYYSGYWSGGDPNSNGPSSTISWSGCIEEADTVNTIVASSPLSVPNGAFDLDIDLIPDSTETRWKPYLRDLEYRRASGSASSLSGTWMGAQARLNSGYSACPREASTLTQYATDFVATNGSVQSHSPSFNNYVDSLTAVGGTMHDIGLIWGARFLSPDGIFSSDNADTTAPGGFQISRHIVFMTDGTLDAKPDNYDAWGVTNLDGRVAPTSTNEVDLEAAHNRRVEIICDQMKGKGYTIWVIGFGIASLPTTLSNCATSAQHADVATNTTQLRARFSKIAETVGGLRLSQ